MRKTKKTKNHFREANATQPKIAFKEVVATLSKKMRWAHTKAYVTISFFEDKEANAP